MVLGSGYFRIRPRPKRILTRMTCEPHISVAWEEGISVIPVIRTLASPSPDAPNAFGHLFYRGHKSTRIKCMSEHPMNTLAYTSVPIQPSSTIYSNILTRLTEKIPYYRVVCLPLFITPTNLGSLA